MIHFQQRAGTLALPETRLATTSATLGERIVQAARMAVEEHLRQNAFDAATQSAQLPIVMGGARHASGDQSHEYSVEYPGHSQRAQREVA